MAAGATLFLGLGLMLYAAYAANPGDACSPEGVMGVNQDVAMTCTGGVWVLNALQLGNKSVTCDSGKAGYLRYSGGNFEGCDGSSWVQLVSSKLKVYKADGVTELGNLVGSYAMGCDGLVYADSSTGTVSSLNVGACSTKSINSTVYFPGANCSGTPFFWSGETQASLASCCTGSATCTTNRCAMKCDPATSSIVYAVTRRTSLGACQTENSNRTNCDTIPACSEDGSPCVVK